MDLVKGLEADVFGASEWALEFLEPLAKKAEGHERALLEWRLAANEAKSADYEGRPHAPVPAPPADELADARVALLDAPGRAEMLLAADAFVARYEETGGTVLDEVLAALCLSNVLKRDARRAAELFEVAADECARRGWAESARGLWYRAMVARRTSGDEEGARAAKGKAEGVP